MGDAERKAVGERPEPVEAEARKAKPAGSGPLLGPGMGDREIVRPVDGGVRPEKRAGPERRAAPEPPPARPPQTMVKRESPTGFQRTVGMIRTVLPLVRTVLPLLDGNVASVVSSILAPHPTSRPVNLEPIQTALSGLRKENEELRGKVAEQSASLKQIGEQLEQVKDAGERHSLEQREAADDLQRLRKRVGLLAWLGLSLLALSLVLNGFLALRLVRFLH